MSLASFQVDITVTIARVILSAVAKLFAEDKGGIVDSSNER